MTRLLAPLLVLAVFAAVVLRLVDRPSLGLMRGRIEAGWHRAAVQPEDRSAVRELVEAHLARFGGIPEERWFAARALLKLGEIERAIDAVWTDEPLAAAPGTARRFAELVLRVSGYHDEETGLRPLPGAPPVTLVLAEGGDEAAIRRLREITTREADGAFLTYFHGVFLFATREVVELVAAGLRERGTAETDVIAALARLGPDPYPERASDLDRLVGVIRGDFVRRERLVWSMACLAVGRSEGERGLEALREVAERLSRSDRESDRQSAAVAEMGRVAGGVWDAARAAAPYLGERARGSPVRLWYADAIAARLQRGDDEAPARLRELLASLRAYPEPAVLARAATALLLRDEVPLEEGLPELLLQDLEAPAATLLGQAVAAAYRYRRGEAEARGRLVDVLRGLAREGWLQADPLGRGPLFLSPILTACRALYLYSPSSAH